MNNGKNKIFFSIIVILIIAGIGVLSYSNYRLKNKESNKINNENIEKNNDSSKSTDLIENETIKISNNELIKYLEIVPVKIFTDDENEVDAYTGDYINTNNISKISLFAKAYESIRKINFEDSYMDCNYAATVNDFETNLKKYYNLTDVPDKIQENEKYCFDFGLTSENYCFGHMGSTIIEYNNKLYACQNSGANNFEKKLSKIVDYNVSENELIIYEKAAFIKEGFENHQRLYNILTTSNLNSKIKTIENIDDADNFFDLNQEQFKTFKHTYKKRNNDYYYYSSESIY